MEEDNRYDQNTMDMALDQLTEDTIRHIIQFLPTKSAFAMSFLFKQFEGAWSFHPVIDLDECNPHFNNYDAFEDRNFTNILTRYLKFRENDPRPLDKFRLRMEMNQIREEILENWLSFLAKRSIKDLDLSLRTAPSTIAKGCNYCLPSTLLSQMKSIVSLSLDYVSLKADGTMGSIHLPSLKTMSLKNMSFLDWLVLSELLRGCSSIENLSITSCSRHALQNSDVGLEVSNSSLKTLDIRDCNPNHVDVLQSKNLEYFTLASNYRGLLRATLFEAKNLKYINIRAQFLSRIVLFQCNVRMKATIDTPNLQHFEFNGLKSYNVHKVIHGGLLQKRLSEAMVEGLRTDILAFCCVARNSD
ncbi:F-box/LRR-repeat protein At4g14103-like [Argentina anserina]|uniref:F-box/LRR-repeat protein At4g14103-like n=1 Tax=Argentina anserina TaxID=57926 RepID=UPI0021768584|nr:F-box/LRR-repeat protein At4g14103-like [Potentilla anserina]